MMSDILHILGLIKVSERKTFLARIAQNDSLVVGGSSVFPDCGRIRNGKIRGSGPTPKLRL